VAFSARAWRTVGQLLVRRLSLRQQLARPPGLLLEKGRRTVNVTPAVSKALRSAAILSALRMHRPLSKSRIVDSLRLDLAANRTWDQSNNARAAWQ
jgi:hypothetical protein